MINNQKIKENLKEKDKNKIGIEEIEYLDLITYFVLTNKYFAFINVKGVVAIRKG
jgi:hypothetical protein